MRLASEFVKLPFRFDVDQLAKELSVVNKNDWIPHPGALAGNFSIPLISLNGEVNDLFNGEMKPTPTLLQSPYFRQVIASFDEVFGRSRLMRLDGGHDIPIHTDVNYHWFDRVRIHIPIVTNPDVTFFCGDERCQMKAGEVWLLDTWKAHRVINESSESRVHLVADTVGSSVFWQRVADIVAGKKMDEKFIAFDPGLEVEPVYEKYNAPLVMMPGELDSLCLDLIADIVANETNDPEVVNQFVNTINEFRWDWRRVWAQFGPTKQGWPEYGRLINRVQRPVKPIYLASNNSRAFIAFQARILGAALNENLLPAFTD
ncbi:aspartyl/asparaginyl beta-hydroxylase domain-containing protein [Oceanicoccus sagamiensis]|uniref:Aspartyl/asparaginy/proline hydroxylase domain-containing protein n=1 Tax=Oceanicoccus sagamiensis TaxID=716816 RepID=A0A1X9NDM0_9GAMM|nr:aspartyl/asparaginyl beta-hydroxylase domain-containing protein [Oceanicoccus sagamiensis]ARN76130.1 hypothetical protein BST96_19730 [Oceanicoccus sagamiensis]